MCRHFPEAVCIHFRPRFFGQENTGDVCRACGLVGFVDIHLVYEEFDVTIKLKRIRLMSDRHISTIPTSVSAVVLVASYINSWYMEGFRTHPVHIRCFQSVSKCRLCQYLI